MSEIAGNPEASSTLVRMNQAMRSSLNAILEVAQLLQGDEESLRSPSQQERLAHVMRGANHLLRLVDAFIDPAGLESGSVPLSLEPVNVAGPKHLVVYVEDNPASIAFMKDLLADFDHVELATAPTAEIGIEIVRARRPDVVIMDINLPGMSGFEATRRLGTWPETRDIPVVGLSASATARDAARLAGAIFHQFLAKPVQVDELTYVLEQCLLPHDDAGTPHPPHSSRVSGSPLAGSLLKGAQ